MNKFNWSKPKTSRWKKNFNGYSKTSDSLRVKVEPKDGRLTKYGYFQQRSQLRERKFVKPLINCSPDIWLTLYNQLRLQNDMMIEVYDVAPDRHSIEMQLVGKYDYVNNTLQEQYDSKDIYEKKKIVTTMYEKVVKLIECARNTEHEGKIFINNDINQVNMIWPTDNLNLIDVDSWVLIDKAGQLLDDANEYLGECYDWLARRYERLDLGKIKNVFY